MKKYIYVLVHNENQYDEFIKEIRESYNRKCKDDQYGYKGESGSNSFPSMFRVDTTLTLVEHQPLMDPSNYKLHSRYKEWTDNLISVSDFILINSEKYRVRVEFTRTTVELGEIEVYAKNKNHARMIALERSDEIEEQDMWESESSEISVNNEYWDWDAEMINKKREGER